MPKKRIVIFGYSGSIHIERWGKALHREGYPLRIISLGGDPIDDLEVIRFPRKGKLSYLYHTGSAARAARAFKPDIIHVHYAGGYGLWGLKTNMRPLLVSVWGSDIEKLPKSIFYRGQIKKILKHATQITATSNSLKLGTQALVPETESRISIIPFGVSFPATVPPLPSENSLACIYLKHLKPVYAPDILIKAVAVAKEKIPELTLTMCGTGKMETELKQLVVKLNLQDTVFFPGHIQYKDIYSLIQKHHVMVMPSLKEGFGVAAVEAFACGRPVIATNVGGIPEIVTHGENGLLVEPNNVEQLAQAITELASNREKMIQMGQNGFDSARKKYCWDKSVRQMVQLYDSL